MKRKVVFILVFILIFFCALITFGLFYFGGGFVYSMDHNPEDTYLIINDEFFINRGNDNSLNFKLSENSAKIIINNVDSIGYSSGYIFGHSSISEYFVLFSANENNQKNANLSFSRYKILLDSLKVSNTALHSTVDFVK